MHTAEERRAARSSRAVQVRKEREAEEAKAVAVKEVRDELDEATKQLGKARSQEAAWRQQKDLAESKEYKAHQARENTTKALREARSPEPSRSCALR